MRIRLLLGIGYLHKDFSFAPYQVGTGFIAVLWLAEEMGLLSFGSYSPSRLLG